MFVCVYEYVRVCMCMCVHVYVRMCMCMCVYACVCVCMHVYVLLLLCASLSIIANRSGQLPAHLPTLALQVSSYCSKANYFGTVKILEHLFCN